MSFLDSPLCRCELMRAMVLTDQSQAQCAQEHECPPGQVCPLRACFADESSARNEAVAAVDANKPTTLA